MSFAQIGYAIAGVGAALFIIGCMLLNVGMPALGGLSLFLSGFSAGFLSLARISITFDPEEEK